MQGAGGSAGQTAGTAGSAGATAAGAAGDSATADGGEGPFPSDDAIGAATYTIASEACGRLFACCDAVHATAFYEDEAECLSQYSSALRGAIHANQEAVLAGRLAIHLEAADNCDGQAISCDASPWSCSSGLFEALVPNGGACDYSIECVEGNCSRESNLCEPRKPPGSDCSFDEECTSGHCDYFGVGCTEPVASTEECVE